MQARCIAYTLVVAAAAACVCSSPLDAQSKPTSKTTEKAAEKAKPAAKFDARVFNVAIGLGGGAGGKFGGRRGGRRRLRSRMAPMALAIAQGLKWLQAQQFPDGGFDAANFMRLATVEKSDGPGEGIGRVGITGLCLLTFLGDGSTLKSGPYKHTVKTAVRWLRTQQTRDSGAFSANVFEHALASYAMTESCGLSKYKILMKGARASIVHLADRQNADGGWNHVAKGGRSDVFTTCHAILAYKSALEFRLVTDATPLKRAEAFINAITGKSGKVPVAILSPLADGVRSIETAVAASLFARFFIGQSPKENPSMEESARLLTIVPTSEHPHDVDPVFEYLGTYGLYQMGGRFWRTWSPRLLLIVKRQRDEGYFEGSWDPLGKGAIQGGRLYSTALSILTLEAYYRYARLVR